MLGNPIMQRAESNVCIAIGSYSQIGRGVTPLRLCPVPLSDWHCRCCCTWEVAQLPCRPPGAGEANKRPLLHAACVFLWISDPYMLRQQSRSEPLLVCVCDREYITRVPTNAGCPLLKPTRPLSSSAGVASALH
ncbi:hypothetical protein XENTR_v10022476 [Xenopus tropicalis]|nr:hypothetical protein XENTR_v10022476 [Xenopus tropicalis]